MQVQGRGFALTRDYLRQTRRRSRTFIRNLSPRMTAELREIVGRYFARQGGPYGRWQPLSAYTIALKGHDTILVDTGRLQRSLTQSTPDSILRVRDLRLIYGTNVPYAYTHETADGVPHRPFMPNEEAYLPQFARWAADHIVHLDRSGVLRVEVP